MKRILLLSCCWILSFALQAQDKARVYDLTSKLVKDSLLAIVNAQKGDRAEVLAWALMSIASTEPDSRMQYAQTGLKLARSLKYDKGEAECLYALGGAFDHMLNIDQCIQNMLLAQDVYQRIGDSLGIAETRLLLQGNYREAGDLDNSLIQGLEGARISAGNQLISSYGFPGHHLAPLFMAEVAKTYMDRHQLDSALLYTERSIAQNELFYGTVWNFPIYLLANIQSEKGEYNTALKNFRVAYPLAISNQFPWDTLQVSSGLSRLYLRTGLLDSAIYYGKIVVKYRSSGESQYVLNAIEALAAAYERQGKLDSAIRYTQFRNFFKDSVYDNRRLANIHNLAFNQKLKQQEIASSQLEYKQALRSYLLAAGLLVFVLVAILLWRNNRHRQKAYRLLEKQKQETEDQRMKTEGALTALKHTQTQLIHSAKMASLGELTAGIAHEIQNPLNFVNNFSDLSIELMDELKHGPLQHLQDSDRVTALALANDLTGNLEKINQHGRRADAIVKGMLQHSRASSGEVHQVDINALVEEYLRLADHGNRTQHEFFEATIQTDFDKTIGKVNVVPQDMGRVLLNVFNNAFYSLIEKKKKTSANFEPILKVSTKRTNDMLFIHVKDNGTGIPEAIIDKIFQPFFTSKPPGKGTGLGLSLTYDIVTAHGGNIAVNTKEAEFAEFIISIPIKEI